MDFMKTIRFILIALTTILISVGFSACSSSSDDDNNSGNPLVGTWLGAASDSGWSRDYKIVFNNNNTGVWGEFSESKNTWKNENFKYTYTSNTITIDFGDGSPEKWEYSISGNTLYIGYFDEKVFKLTKQ